MSIITSNLFLFIVVTVGAIFGYKLNSLTRTGAIATIIVGYAVIMGFGFEGLFLMGVFFVTSSCWSEYKTEKKRTVEEKLKKSGARDAVQVLANGGVPAIISLLYLFFDEQLLLYMFIAALATANSDTWASEIGSLSKKRPLHIFTFKKVEAGTSGAISFLGTISAILGAFLIGGCSLLLWKEIPLQIGFLLGFIGFIGNFIDTILGATVQVTYRCSQCGIVTEKNIHCNEQTIYRSGCKLFNNDTVNFLSIALGSLLIVLLPI